MIRHRLSPIAQHIHDEFMAQPVVLPPRPKRGDYVRVTQELEEHFGLVGLVGFVDRKPFWDVDVYAPAFAPPAEQKRYRFDYLGLTILNPLEVLAEAAR